jgi:hypothetical protein
MKKLPPLKILMFNRRRLIFGSILSQLNTIHTLKAYVSRLSLALSFYLAYTLIAPDGEASKLL